MRIVLPVLALFAGLVSAGLVKRDTVTITESTGDHSGGTGPSSASGDKVTVSATTTSDTATLFLTLTDFSGVDLVSDSPMTSEGNGAFTLTVDFDTHPRPRVATVTSSEGGSADSLVLLDS
ncbi:hypothetical protein GGX14DRAFT_629084 [Mycena pura]|uniref:Uncharacterized protein n=1 Tax=Mycena pura TaxID=153505 RepID=A0AAD6YRL4_9AGAR|nr:hypothetical protein GGX14DRAFT_629084 [Mycena pura]